MKAATPWTMFLLGAALSWARQVVAADCSGHLTITRTQDLSSLRACPTYSGSVTVKSISISLPPNDYNTELKLDGVEKITGDLVFKDISVAKGDGALIVWAPNLKKVNHLTFTDISPLEMPEFPRLEKALDITFKNIDFRDYTEFNPRKWPKLQQLNWLTVVNTTMTKIGGWDTSLVIQPSEVYMKLFPNYRPLILLTGKDNPSLNEISLQGFDNSSSGIVAMISNNGKDLQVDFPRFEHSILWVSNVADFSAIDLKTLSVDPSLFNDYEDAERPSNGNPGFVDNIFTALDLPNVVSIENEFDIANNTYLSYLILPALGSLDSLQIQGNPEFKDLSLPELVDVRGELNISGSFDSISLPQLADAGGNLDIQSTGGKFTCSEFNSRQEHTLFIKGKYSCSTTSTGLSTGAKAGIGIGVALAVCAIVALCGYLWIRYRRKRPARSVDDKIIPHTHRTSWKELDSGPAKVEAGGTELHELEGKTTNFDTSSSIMELESPAVASELDLTPHQTEFPSYPREKE